MIEVTEAGYVIAGVSIVLALFSTLVRHAVVDVNRSKEIREKIKEHQAEIKKLSKSGETKKLAKANEEVMTLTMENMRMAYKPMFITLIPFILVLGWLNGTYGDLNPTYNVTIQSSLPQNVTVLEAKMDNGGNYSAENKTLVWRIPKARSDTEGEVSSQLTLGSTDLGLLNSSLVELSYFDENGTERIASSDLAQPQDSALMSVKKDVAVGSQPNSASYRVAYKNLRTNNVVFFPVYADICIGIGVFHMHNGLDWFGWYFVCAMVTSLIMNKALERYAIQLWPKKQ